METELVNIVVINGNHLTPIQAKLLGSLIAAKLLGNPVQLAVKELRELVKIFDRFDAGE